MSEKVFVCDLGFSSAKCVFGEERFRVFSAYKDKGNDFLVGDEALRGVGASYLKTPEDLVRRYPAFVKKCMERSDVNASSVPVAVGVPFSFWRDQSQLPGRGMLSAIEAGIKELPNISFVGVYPQGLGGIRAFLEDNQDVTGNILAIDIGFNTVIFNLFNVEEGELIHGDTLYKRGMTQMVTEHLQDKIKQHTPGHSFSPIEVCVLLEEASIQYGFQQIGIKEEIEQATLEYMERILDDISGELRAHGGQKARFNTVIVFGGGAHYVGEAFLKKSSKQLSVFVLEDPEYANSIGFASLANDDIQTATLE